MNKLKIALLSLSVGCVFPVAGHAQTLGSLLGNITGQGDNFSISGVFRSHKVSMILASQIQNRMASYGFSSQQSADFIETIGKALKNAGHKTKRTDSYEILASAQGWNGNPCEQLQARIQSTDGAGFSIQGQICYIEGAWTQNGYLNTNGTRGSSYQPESRSYGSSSAPPVHYTPKVHKPHVKPVEVAEKPIPKAVVKSEPVQPKPAKQIPGVETLTGDAFGPATKDPEPVKQPETVQKPVETVSKTVQEPSKEVSKPVETVSPVVAPAPTPAPAPVPKPVVKHIDTSDL